ncbi:MAG: hypothetical protein IT304_05655 [Dehalococcoidia bacterium]|nr:hypothetical protein [Dehalococcoidia bacterium]
MTADNAEVHRRPFPRLCQAALLASGVMGVYWMVLGITWYGKVVPFYDSMGYQRQYFWILSVYHRDGMEAALRESWDRPSTRLYPLLEALFAPALPQSIAGLYLVSYLVLMVALAAVIWLSYVLTRSARASVAVVLSLTALEIFAELRGGILDQRIDLIAAFLLLAAVLALMALFEHPRLTRYWAAAGLLSALALLDRPISAAPIVLTAAVLAVAHWRQLRWMWRPDRLKVLALGAPLIAAGLVIFPLWRETWTYYVSENADVGRFASASDSLRFAKDTVGDHMGRAMVLAVLAAYGFLLWRGRWREAAVCLAIPVLALTPFVLSRSGGNPFVLLSPTMLVLLPIVFALREMDERQRLAVAVAALTLTLMRVVSLNDDVFATPGEDRALLAEVAGRIHRAQPDAVVQLSGLEPVADSIDGIDMIEGLNRLDPGKHFFHVTDFGLPASAIDDPASVEVAKRQLEQLCLRPGVIIAAAPGEKNDPTSYLYSYRHTEEFGEAIRGLDCLGEALGGFRFERREYVIYMVN